METTHIKNIEYLYLGEKSNFFSVSSCGVQHKKNGLRPNHLGNVHLVLSDRKQTSTYDNTLAAYEYYPFGMAMQTYETDAYRYGYQGSEKDNDLSGEGNSYTTHYRQLDVRLVRWFSIDPELDKLPYFSPYAAMECSPIKYTDIYGDYISYKIAVENKKGKIVLRKAPPEVVELYKKAFEDLSSKSETFKADYEKIRKSRKKFTLVDLGQMQTKKELYKEGDSKEVKEYNNAIRRRRNSTRMLLHGKDKAKLAVVNAEIVNEENIKGTNAATIDGKLESKKLRFNGRYMVINLSLKSTQDDYKDINYDHSKKFGGYGLLIHELSHWNDARKNNSDRKGIREERAVKYQDKVGKEIEKNTGENYDERKMY